MLDALENSNDVPEVLGASGDLDDVRDELEAGIELVGMTAPSTTCSDPGSSGGAARGDNPRGGARDTRQV
jgi:hypothetical protein